MVDHLPHMHKFLVSTPRKTTKTRTNHAQRHKPVRKPATESSVHLSNDSGEGLSEEHTERSPGYTYSRQ